MLDEMMNISIKQTTKINLIVKSILMFRPSVSCQSSRLEQHFSTALPFQVHLKHTHQIKSRLTVLAALAPQTPLPLQGAVKWNGAIMSAVYLQRLNITQPTHDSCITRATHCSTNHHISERTMGRDKACWKTSADCKDATLCCSWRVRTYRDSRVHRWKTAVSFCLSVH